MKIPPLPKRDRLVEHRVSLRRSPVGALSLPEPVGGNGGVFYSSFVVNF